MHESKFVLYRAAYGLPPYITFPKKLYLYSTFTYQSLVHFFSSILIPYFIQVLAPLLLHESHEGDLQNVYFINTFYSNFKLILYQKKKITTKDFCSIV